MYGTMYRKIGERICRVEKLQREHLSSVFTLEEVRVPGGPVWQSRHWWVVVKIMVPFWVPNIIRHLLFRVPKEGP